MNKLHLAVFAAIVLLSGYFLLSLRATAEPGQERVSVERQECIEEEVQNCSANSCNGTRVCSNGIWSGCIAEQVCIPGQNYSCVENSCIIGYKTCNECGSGYGECARQTTDKS